MVSVATTSVFSAILLTNHDVQRITPEKVRSMQDNGDDLIIVDVRPKISFKKKHIVGATSVPLAETENLLKAHSRKKHFVFY
ncbi:MAG: rhodanese-like domain-containing protein [Nitrospira sp.]|nr:rhodanese-like domain-containing protein [Nitrospira sp.]